MAPHNQILKYIKTSYQFCRLLAQTTLRNILGTKNLHEILSDRESIAGSMQTVLDEATHDWGIKVERVEMWVSDQISTFYSIYLLLKYQCCIRNISKSSIQLCQINREMLFHKKITSHPLPHMFLLLRIKLLLWMPKANLTVYFGSRSYPSHQMTIK